MDRFEDEFEKLKPLLCSGHNFMFEIRLEYPDKMFTQTRKEFLEEIRACESCRCNPTDLRFAMIEALDKCQ